MSTSQVGDRVRVKRLESWRINSDIPGLSVGDVGTVADVYRWPDHIGVLFDGGDYVSHYAGNLDIVALVKHAAD